MIIDGKLVSQSIKDQVKKEIESLKEKYNKVPTLCVIQIGDNPASITYVKKDLQLVFTCHITSEFEFTNLTFAFLIDKLKNPLIALVSSCFYL